MIWQSLVWGRPARGLAEVWFRDERARGLFAGLAAHSISRLLLDPQLHILRDIALDSSRPLRRGRCISAPAYLAIVSAPPHWIAQGFMRRIDRLRPCQRFRGVGIQIGMIPFREQPVGAANLRERASPFEPERGVVIFVFGVHAPSLINRRFCSRAGGRVEQRLDRLRSFGRALGTVAGFDPRDLPVGPDDNRMWDAGDAILLCDHLIGIHGNGQLPIARFDELFHRLQHWPIQAPKMVPVP